MGKINLLSFEVANLIAAGEVVDRPASVIKELAENSIDAHADRITVEIQRGGVLYMRVTDNGSGILPEDLPLAVKRHATSKIKEAADLGSIMTLGFRGEALAAIGSVSDLRIISKIKDSPMGASIEVNSGRVGEVNEQGARDGTTVIVENLFANVPARLKFLKRDITEAAAVVATVEKIALSHPDIAFRVISDGVIRLETPGDGRLQSVMRAVYGKEQAEKMLKIETELGGIRTYGYVSSPDMPRASRTWQNFFINRRYIKSRTVQAALEQAYTSYIPPEKFPSCALFIDIRPEAVDVNVHPAKLEVKFSNERPVFECVYHAVREALTTNTARPEGGIGVLEPSAAGPAPAGVRPSGSAEGQPSGFAEGIASGFAEGNASDSAKGIASGSSGVQSSGGAGARSSDELGFRSSGSAEGQPSGFAEGIASGSAEGNASGFAEGIASGSAEGIASGFAEGRPSGSAEGNAYGGRGSVTGRARQGRPFGAPPLSRAYVPLPDRSGRVRADDSIDMPDYPRGGAGITSAPSGTAVPAGPAAAAASPQWRIAGELFNTYIVVEEGDALTLFDKHAAHERLNFEKMRARLRGAVRNTSLLALPLEIDLGTAGADAVERNREEIEKIGFDFTRGERGMILVGGIPEELDRSEVPPLFERFAEALTEGAGDVSLIGENAFEKALYQASCKASVKGGRVYPPGYAEYLVGELMRRPDITYCPHGRPIAVRIRKADLDRRFGRN
ncbi:MAG: DNA mismatch repair endonuclease MutL [Clostridia bacterium]|nr:DNA mismatch repair endonuclease MutL [Clostridia bacterium]